MTNLEIDWNKEMQNLKKLMEEGKIKLLKDKNLIEDFKKVMQKPDGSVVEETIPSSIRALILSIKAKKEILKMDKKVYFDTIDYYILPEKYHLDHEYCIYLHDQLVKIIVEGEKLEVFKQSIKTKRKFPKIKGEDLFDWVRENFPRQAKKYMIKGIFEATLSDALQFIFTALQSSTKGKLSVTYALLRKPLKDNLFILELLNTDKKDFFKRFKDPANLLNLGRGFSPEERKEIINKNAEKIKFHANFNSIIFDSRYNKSARGFEPLFQKANHITTNANNLQTEEENLNFVFLNDESRDSQWKKLYKILPFLLRYFVDTAYYVLNKNITTRLKDDLNLIDILYYRRHYPQIAKMMPFNISCTKCGRSSKATKKILDLCEKTRMYTCPCGEKEPIINVELYKNKD